MKENDEASSGSYEKNVATRQDGGGGSGWKIYVQICMK